MGQIEAAPVVSRRLIAGKTGISQGVRLCRVCTAILPAEQGNAHAVIPMVMYDVTTAYSGQLRY